MGKSQASQVSQPSNGEGYSNVAATLCALLAIFLIIGICLWRCKSGTLRKLNHELTRSSPPVDNAGENRTGLGREKVNDIPLVKYDADLISKVEKGHASSRATVCPNDGTRGPVTGTRVRKQRLEIIERLAPWWDRIRHNTSSWWVLLRRRQSDKDLMMMRLELACSICTEDFVAGTHVRLLHCGHIFHPQCVDPWLIDKAVTCPLCRTDLTVASAADSVSRPQRTASYVYWRGAGLV